MSLYKGVVLNEYGSIMDKTASSSFPGPRPNDYFWNGPTRDGLNVTSSNEDFNSKDMLEILQYCRYFFNYDSIVQAAVRSLTNYAVTKPTFSTVSSSKVAKRNLKILEKHMFQRYKLLDKLLVAGLDYFTYGNHFMMNYSTAESDRTILRPVSPLEMSLDEDPLTGETEYYWKIAKPIARMIENRNDEMYRKKYHRFMKEFPEADMVVKAYHEEKPLLLRNENIYHLRMVSDSGSNHHWGFPYILPAMKLLVYRNILRRAQEAIARQHIIPKTMFYLNPVGDEKYNLAMYKQAADVLKEKLQGLNDRPNDMLVSPVPVGVVYSGGQARSLMVTPDIQQVEDEILAALGTVREFVFGGLNYSGTMVSLRTLENKIEPFRQQVTNLIKHLYLPTAIDDLELDFPAEEISVKLMSLRTADDIQSKNFYMGAWQAGLISATTFTEVLGFDPVEEAQHKLTDVKRQAVLDMASMEVGNVVQLEQAKKQQELQGMMYNTFGPPPPEEEMPPEEGEEVSEEEMPEEEAPQEEEQQMGMMPGEDVEEEEAPDPDVIAQAFLSLPPEELQAFIEGLPPGTVKRLQKYLENMGIDLGGSEEMAGGAVDMEQLPEQRPEAWNKQNKNI